VQNRPSPPNKGQRNGHPTVGENAPAATTDNEGNEPKGLPTSDRYHSETVHASETDDHTKITKPNNQK
jgi:hypothetical protein